MNVLFLIPIIMTRVLVDVSITLRSCTFSLSYHFIIAVEPTEPFNSASMFWNRLPMVRVIEIPGHVFIRHFGARLCRLCWSNTIIVIIAQNKLYSQSKFKSRNHCNRLKNQNIFKDCVDLYQAGWIIKFVKSHCSHNKMCYTDQ